MWAGWECTGATAQAADCAGCTAGITPPAHPSSLPAPASHLWYRDGLLLALHVAVFVLQYWWPSHMGSAEWVAGGSVLASQPAGLWLLIAVFTLQVSVLEAAMAVAELYCMLVWGLNWHRPACSDVLQAAVVLQAHPGCPVPPAPTAAAFCAASACTPAGVRCKRGAATRGLPRAPGRRGRLAVRLRGNRVSAMPCAGPLSAGERHATCCATYSTAGCLVASVLASVLCVLASVLCVLASVLCVLASVLCAGKRAVCAVCKSACRRLRSGCDVAVVQPFPTRTAPLADCIPHLSPILLLLQWCAPVCHLCGPPPPGCVDGGSTRPSGVCGAAHRPASCGRPLHLPLSAPLCASTCVAACPFWAAAPAES